jgi:acyl-CoA reductase-like NAD-dependent aldehyde dehydrogenase
LGADAGLAYAAPHVLVDVNHTMDVMVEETYGPVVGIMPVDTDDEAVSLMNDSPYGLSASIWTADPNAAEEIGNRVETGTVFMNRADLRHTLSTPEGILPVSGFAPRVGVRDPSGVATGGGAPRR